jgi:hypothetical protein
MPSFLSQHLRSGRRRPCAHGDGFPMDPEMRVAASRLRGVVEYCGSVDSVGTMSAEAALMIVLSIPYARDKAIARLVGRAPRTVRRWKDRYRKWRAAAPARKS